MDDDAAVPRAAGVPALRRPDVVRALEQCVDITADRLVADPGRYGESADRLTMLTTDELATLRDARAEYLRILVAPDTTLDDVAAHGESSGRIHAMVGVDMSWYADGIESFRSAIASTISRILDRDDAAGLNAVIAERVSADIRAHLHAHREVEDSVAKVSSGITAAASRATTLPDLIRGVLGELAALPGFCLGYFGRPDNGGIFRFEIGVGKHVEAFFDDAASGRVPPISSRVQAASGLGPSGRAWRTGRIVRADAYQTEPSTTLWHDIGRRLGLRSSAAIPLAGRDGRSAALLAVYMAWPGYFAPAGRMQLLEHARHLTEWAMHQIQSRHIGAQSVIAYRQRSSSISELERNNVVMHFQPIIDLTTGAVVKLEALARLSAEGRLLHPGEFLPSFGQRELSLLFDIGLTQALDAVSAWHRAGLDAGVSVNLPVTVALTNERIDRILGSVADRGISPSALTLEVLETAEIGSRIADYHGKIRQLRRGGIHIAEDDLGAGHSSLLRLRHLEFDEVKIDQGLVYGAELAPADPLGFVQALTGLAHRMGLAVTVEGLEAPGFVEAASILGADRGQGYSIAAPMPADEVVDWAHAFRMKVDRARPVTPVGGLAAHLMWEAHLDRSAAPRPPAPPLEDCPLTAMIESFGERGSRPARIHRAIHRIAIAEPYGTRHRRLWGQLVAVMVREPAETG